jgi:MFS family permease
VTPVQRFARVLRAPDVARLLGAAVLARMPIGIDSLGMVLFVRAETGSFARAGLVAAAFGLGVGCSAPVLGRLIDRHGHARVLLPLAGLHAGSLGALVAFGLAGAPTGVLVACGLAAGISVPPVGSVVRPLLVGLLEDDAGLLPTAYALDGIAIELVFVTGPLLTAAIVVVASPAVALLVACGFVIVGTIVLVTTPASRAWRPDARQHERHLLGALASPGMRTIVAATAPVGFALGATEVTMTAFAADHGSRAAAGALMAAWAAGSGVGGLSYGGREHASSPGARWVRLAAVFPLCSLPLLLAPSILAMAPLALIAGLCLAPYMAAANQLVGDVAPPGAVTEAFAWPITAIGLGAAGGSAVAGAIAQSWGWRPGFGAVVAAGTVTALIAVAGRATVRA